MIEVLKQSAENVSKVYDILAFGHTERALEILAKTRTSLRQAIAELESQNPVIDKLAATRIATSLGWSPQRTWVGLTDEEKHKTWYEMQNIMGWYSFQEIANAIEAKLKERNI